MTLIYCFSLLETIGIFFSCSKIGHSISFLIKKGISADCGGGLYGSAITARPLASAYVQTRIVVIIQPQDMEKCCLQSVTYSIE